MVTIHSSTYIDTLICRWKMTVYFQNEWSRITCSMQVSRPCVSLSRMKKELIFKVDKTWCLQWDCTLDQSLLMSWVDLTQRSVNLTFISSLKPHLRHIYSRIWHIAYICLAFSSQKIELLQVVRKRAKLILKKSDPNAIWTKQVTPGSMMTLLADLSSFTRSIHWILSHAHGVKHGFSGLQNSLPLQ